MNMLISVTELLSHIKNVELDVIKMTEDSMLMLDRFLEKNNMELDDDAIQALQYQDIISQQLTATIEAIDSVSKSMEVFQNAYKSDEKIVNESLTKLNEKLTDAIAKAKDRRDAFSGKLGHKSENEIEFF